MFQEQPHPKLIIPTTPNAGIGTNAFNWKPIFSYADLFIDTDDEREGVSDLDILGDESFRGFPVEDPHRRGWHRSRCSQGGRPQGAGTEKDEFCSKTIKMERWAYIYKF